MVFALDSSFEARRLLRATACVSSFRSLSHISMDRPTEALLLGAAVGTAAMPRPPPTHPAPPPPQYSLHLTTLSGN